jgi:hypothetical protein
MATARKVLATTVTLIGLAAGAAGGAAWIYLMWPTDEWERRHISAVIGPALILCGLAAWPFMWLSNRIDPAPEGDSNNGELPAAPTAAPHSRRAHSTASRPTTPPQ